MKGIWLDRIAILVSIIMLMLYLSTMSISLDDEDSAHFALGIREFNVTKYQPHPPGFPAYIGMGMLLNTFVGNGLLALTLLSALSGAGCVYVFYLLLREMANRRVALMSSFLMAITPLFWLNSVKALSDMPGLFFTLLSLFFVYNYHKHSRRRNLLIGALVAGIAAGVRIHSAAILIPVILYSALLCRKDRKSALMAGGVFALTVLAWLVPVMLVTGPAEYVNVIGEQLAFRAEVPEISLVGSGTGDILERVIGFPYFFLLEGYGINLAGLGILSVALLVLMAALFGMFLREMTFRDERFLFLLSGVLPYLIMVFVFFPPFNPRYLLVIVPIISVCLVKAILFFESKKRWMVLSLLAFLLLFHSVYLASIIKSVPSPPVQLIGYVNDDYEPGDVILLPGFAERYFAYYGTSLGVLPAESTDCETIRSTPMEGSRVFSVVQKDCQGIGSVKVMEFSRDSRVHIKRSRIGLYELLPI